MACFSKTGLFCRGTQTCGVHHNGTCGDNNDGLFLFANSLILSRNADLRRLAESITVALAETIPMDPPRCARVRQSAPARAKVHQGAPTCAKVRQGAPAAAWPAHARQGAQTCGAHHNGTCGDHHNGCAKVRQGAPGRAKVHQGAPRFANVRQPHLGRHTRAKVRRLAEPITIALAETIAMVCFSQTVLFCRGKQSYFVEKCSL